MGFGEDIGEIFFIWKNKRNIQSSGFVLKEKRCSLYDLSGLTVKGITETLGINEELVSKAISVLNIGKAGTFPTEKEIEQIKVWIKTRQIDTTISYHVMTEKHGFNKKCGPDCIIQVANNLRKLTKTWMIEGVILIVRGNRKCKHDCTIEVRLSIPPNEYFGI